MPKRRRPLPDSDFARPATWRWILFVTLCLIVASFWIPTAASDARVTKTPFVWTNVLLLLGLVGLAAAVLPATLRTRMIWAAALLGATAIAWSLQGGFRDLFRSS